jgi:glucose-6-phosphate 1-epimerase
VAGGRERLYLSPQAIFDGQSAIRGGIPLCFPQFNQRGPLPKHGFARNLTWAAQAPLSDTEQDASVLRLRLHSSPTTQAIWPQHFEAQLALTLGEGLLRVQLDVCNTSKTLWEFTAALHTYLAVDAVESTRLEGLEGCARWDAVRDQHGLQSGAVTIAGEYDRVFRAPVQPMRLHDGPHSLQISQSQSLGSTVVWNPGASLSSRLPDLPADGYRSMLCVEAAQIDELVPLAPAEPWQGWQELRVL